MDPQALNKPYSEETAAAIDSEVRGLVDAAYVRTKALLEEKRDLVTKLAEELLEREVVSSEDLTRILGPRPFSSDELRNIDKFKRGFDGEGEEEEDEEEEGEGSVLDSEVKRKKKRRKSDDSDGPAPDDSSCPRLPRWPSSRGGSGSEARRFRRKEVVERDFDDFVLLLLFPILLCNLFLRVKTKVSSLLSSSSPLRF